jgi:hypothetical protein
MAKYKNLVNKHIILEKQLVTLKRTFKGNARADKELIASLKKIRGNNRRRLEAKKKKGWRISALRKKKD